jgi:hypothetical protein
VNPRNVGVVENDERNGKGSHSLDIGSKLGSIIDRVKFFTL